MCANQKNLWKLMVLADINVEKHARSANIHVKDTERLDLV